MTPIEKVAIFLMMLGMEKGQSVIALMDSDEIKAVISEIQKLTVVTQEMEARVLAEFEEFGYDDDMKAFEVLSVIRYLFDGRKISTR